MNSNRLLGAFLGVLATHMILNFIFETNPNTQIPDITSTLGFLYGPLLYVFIISHIYKDLPLERKHLLHLIPWMAALLIGLISPRATDYFGGGIFLNLVVYISLSFVSIHKYQKVLTYTQSKFDSIALNWIKHVLYLFLTLSIFETIRNFLISDSIIFESFFYAFLVCSLLIFVVTLVFKGLRQPELFSGITLEDVAISSSAEAKYNASALSNEKITQLAEVTQTYLTTEKSYLNPDLNLEELARDTSTSARVLSQVINSHFDKNFSEYINFFRIEEAKKLLIASLADGTTVLEIAYASGFNSKSNFYTAFKQQTGITPSQFKSSIA
jgi:AraC-like DNA-binding protein